MMDFANGSRQIGGGPELSRNVSPLGAYAHPVSRLGPLPVLQHRLEGCATLSELLDTTRTVGNVSGRATPVVANLATATEDLGPAITDLASAARDGRKLVPLVDAALPSVIQAGLGATSAGRGLVRATPGLKGTLCQLNPMLRYILPYKDDVLQVAYHLGSASHAYDATGHTIRLLPINNENTLSGAPPAVIDSARFLLQSGLFTGQTKRITYDPYMKPGIIGKTVAERCGSSSAARHPIIGAGYAVRPPGRPGRSRGSGWADVS